ETGCGSNVSTVSDPAITSRWPRWTPSNVPTATLRASARSTSGSRVTFTPASLVSARAGQQGEGAVELDQRRALPAAAARRRRRDRVGDGERADRRASELQAVGI